MMRTHAILLLAVLTVAQCFPKGLNSDIYKVIENNENHAVTFVNPKQEKPVLRDITYYHVVERAYDGKDEDTNDGSVAKENSLDDTSVVYYEDESVDHDHVHSENDHSENGHSENGHSENDHEKELDSSVEKALEGVYNAFLQLTKTTPKEENRRELPFTLTLGPEDEFVIDYDENEPIAEEQKNVEDITDITEDVTGVTEDLTDVTEDLTDVTEDLTDATEDVTAITESTTTEPRLPTLEEENRKLYSSPEALRAREEKFRRFYSSLHGDTRESEIEENNPKAPSVRRKRSTENEYPLPEPAWENIEAEEERHKSYWRSQPDSNFKDLIKEEVMRQFKELGLEEDFTEESPVDKTTSKISDTLYVDGRAIDSDNPVRRLESLSRQNTNLWNRRGYNKGLKVNSEKVYGNAIGNEKVNNFYFFFDDKYNKEALKDILPLISDKPYGNIPEIVTGNEPSIAEPGIEPKPSELDAGFVQESNQEADIFNEQPVTSAPIVEQPQDQGNQEEFVQNPTEEPKSEESGSEIHDEVVTTDLPEQQYDPGYFPQGFVPNQPADPNFFEHQEPEPENKENPIEPIETEPSITPQPYDPGYFPQGFVPNQPDDPNFFQEPLKEEPNPEESASPDEYATPEAPVTESYTPVYIPEYDIRSQPEIPDFFQEKLPEENLEERKPTEESADIAELEDEKPAELPEENVGQETLALSEFPVQSDIAEVPLAPYPQVEPVLAVDEAEKQEKAEEFEPEVPEGEKTIVINVENVPENFRTEPVVPYDQPAADESQAEVVEAYY